MDRRETQRKKFYGVIPSDSRFLFSRRKLQRYIKRVIATQEVSRKKSPGDYALLKRYDVARIGGAGYILIKKNSIDPYIRYIPEDEVFDAIYDAHIKVGHGGQKKTHYELKKSIANVTREQVALFLSYCVICEEKKSIKKNKRVVRPITSSGFGERGQVDLIDMRSCKTTDNHCFILHYQDHFTKFSILKALQSKQTSEVSHHLYDIFTLIGAPKILQSDNGNEFVGAPLTAMMQTFWPETELVRGSPRHPQSQGSVERANGHIKKILWGLTREKNMCSWVDLLKQVQWIKNTVNHRVIGMSPYEAMFGQNHTTPMKIREQMEIEEEDGDGVQQQQQCQQQEEQPWDEQMTPMEENADEVQEQHRRRQQQQGASCVNEVETFGEEESVEDEETHASADEDKQHLEEMLKIRQRVRDGIKQQASKMIKSNYPSSLYPEINDCVNVMVPLVDRPRKMSLQNIVGIIVAIKEKKGHKLYSVATKHGCIKPLLSRNQFEICRQRNLIEIETVNRERTVSIRKIAALEALEGCGRPSSTVCYCATDNCRTMRCLCWRSGFLCTELCKHGRNPQSGRINEEIAANFKCFNN